MTSLLLHPALLGGVLIGLAATLLYAFNGRVAGISGIAQGALVARGEELTWRVLFLVGLSAGGLLVARLVPSAQGVGPGATLTAVGGLLVGFGARLGGGCTSGHGVCGVSRLSTRAIAATCTFIVMGMVTTYVARHLVGGGG